MTHAHIMLTEQGFVAFELPDEYSLSHKEQFSTSVLFAPEEQEKVRKAAHFKLIGEEEPNGHTWVPEKNTPYALPDGVEVEIRGRCKVCNKQGVRHCAHPEECGSSEQLAYLKTKEVKEESQDQIIENLIATWQASAGNDSEDEYSEVKRKFKVTRI